MQTRFNNVVAKSAGRETAPTAPEAAARLTYVWERVHTHLRWGWVIPAAEATVGQVWERTYSHAHSLSMAFDEGGVLQTVRATNVNVRITETQ